MVEPALTTPKVASLIVGSIAFFAAMIYVGVRTQNWIESASDFLVSGREINGLIIGFGMAAIALAGSIVSAIPEFVADYGYFPAQLYMLGWVVVICLFGILMGPIIRRTGVYTTSEWMEQRFNRKTRAMTAVGTVLASVALTAAQFVGIGAILAVVTDAPFWQTTLFIAVATFVYMYFGGLWAVTVTDVLQYIIGATALVLTVGWLTVTLGDFGWLSENIPESTQLLALAGTGEVSLVGLGFQNPVTWTLGWAALVIGNQYYWIRIVSARSERDSRRGPVLAGAMALLLGPIIALLGLYAFAQFGSPEAAGYDIRGIAGLFILQLPVGIDALLLVSLLAAVMSTVSTTVIGATTIFMRDVWEPLRGTPAGSEEVIGPSRVFTVGFGVASWLLAAVWTGSAALLLALGWAFVGPMASVVLLGLFWKRTTGTAAFLGILFGVVSVILWQPTGLAEFAHPTWPGIFVPAVVTVLISLVTEPPYYGKRGWEKGKMVGPEKPRKDRLRVMDSLRGEFTNPGTQASEGVSGADADTDAARTRRLARELTKPWTPFERWNRAVERRGEGRSIAYHLLSDEAAGSNGSDERGERR